MTLEKNPIGVFDSGLGGLTVVKALKKGDPLLADLIYSGVPASWFGREQEIEVGPMSGNSNILYWLHKNGYEGTEAEVAKIRHAAKNTNRLLSNAELKALMA